MRETIKKAQELLENLPGVLEEYGIKEEEVVSIEVKIGGTIVSSDVLLYRVEDVKKFNGWTSYIGKHVKDTRFYTVELKGFKFTSNEPVQNAD